MKTPCYLSIGWVHSPNNERNARITIADAISGCHVAEVDIDARQFALALSTLAHRPAMLEFRPAAFGQVFETKEELVRDLRPDPKAEEKATKPFRRGGWEPRHGDYGNHHRWFHDTATGEAFYRVTFYRSKRPSRAEMMARCDRFNESLKLEGLPPIPVPKVVPECK